MERKERVISKAAKAGSLESNDLMIMIEPSDKLDIILNSVVKEQYGDKILKAINEVLDEEGVTKANIVIEDKGALDFTIRARMRTAIERSQNEL
ncbi:MAG: citrate lyase acyl carrier protein [Eubacteriales bacterium]|uniref:citrate lyase acyl carrier protein n=1 Tax=Fenollaria sp. TaxID=1965292 RepID=UPI002A75A7E8|nr:citrate lyase acyl carrier protein [Fenollaria sp.]MDD7339206.1 citrate lyase acyl carrier protein [Eubacteriales bacterium]MDY3106202.1 citrate lyase acyl carrier protein [Fenollaria sp.]